MADTGPDDEIVVDTRLPADGDEVTCAEAVVVLAGPGGDDADRD
jgi:hypothetical protein